jgi:hypothetical protein
LLPLRTPISPSAPQPPHSAAPRRRRAESPPCRARAPQPRGGVLHRLDGFTKPQEDPALAAVAPPGALPPPQAPSRRPTASDPDPHRVHAPEHPTGSTSLAGQAAELLGHLSMPPTTSSTLPSCTAVEDPPPVSYSPCKGPKSSPPSPACSRRRPRPTFAGGKPESAGRRRPGAMGDGSHYLWPWA